VASTVGVCIFGGRLLAIWVVSQDENFSRPNKAIQVIKATSILLLCTKYLAAKTHQLTAEWMDSFSFLESSLRACPRSIKSNLEMSKLYSGETAHKIDPTYCDVHQQYGPFNKACTSPSKTITSSNNKPNHSCIRSKTRVIASLDFLTELDITYY
jgi:hypothetical protein